jgi:integrase
MPARYRALVVLAAGTGQRQGEAFAVEVEAVEWLRRTLRVDRQLVLLPGGEPYIAGATGRPPRRTRFSDIWRPAAAAAGLGDG